MRAKVKAVVAKIGLDGHYRGVKFVTRSLTDAGVEAVYLGANQTEDDIVNAVVQEDADLVALSFLSPDYRYHVPALIRRLQAIGAGDVVVIVGGLVADDDVDGLLKVGVRRIFGPATVAADIREFLDEAFPADSKEA
jgi:methylmalonyl-CoA mutase C-terminal domain/subunit